ncbi:MAG: putative 4-mercaptohistidine N1-methyltransferase [Parachlamydia sp.]|nr:putative 4-mercaptohistidine N1-methyltransferase [Parachlamydia sp.]
MTGYYSSDRARSEYLLFHYGSDEDLSADDLIAKTALHFPVRCVTECLDPKLPPHARALDLGCAVGRSSFELARHCEKVVGVDSSKIFIEAARTIQKQGFLEYPIIEEGSKIGLRLAQRPEGISQERIEFVYQDALGFCRSSALFDVVLVANLICRLENPKALLAVLSAIVSSGGQLILTSPYSWLEDYTPRANWLDGLQSLKDILGIHFELQRTFDMPFLIREHLRKYQCVIAQASIWKKK